MSADYYFIILLFQCKGRGVRETDTDSGVLDNGWMRTKISRIPPRVMQGTGDDEMEPQHEPLQGKVVMHKLI